MAVFNRKRMHKQAVKHRTTGLVIKIVRTLFIIGLCYLFAFPLYYLCVVGFQHPVAAQDPTVLWIPKQLSLDNFRLAMEFMEFYPSMWLTLAISFFSTLATLLSCSMVGYGFARFRFKEKNFAFALVMLLIIVPPQTTMIPSYLNYRFFDFAGLMKLTAPITGVDHINLLNSVWTFVIPSLFGAGLRSGLFIFIFRQFFLGLPKELEEAARIDGCGAFRTFWRIIMPLSVPAITTVALFSFVWHWNESYLTTMYFSDKVKPLAVQLSRMIEMFTGDFYNANTVYTATQLRGAIAAGGLLSIALPLVLYIFAQKYFTESIERSGIVG